MHAQTKRALRPRKASNRENHPPVTSKHSADSSRPRLVKRGDGKTSKNVAAKAAKKKAHLKAKKDRDVVFDLSRVASSSTVTPTVPATFTKPASANLLPTEFSLPRHLRRPDVLEVSREAITAVNPDLESVDFQFIRDHLAEFGPAMLEAVTSTKVKPSNDPVPNTVDIVASKSMGNLPTHVIGVHGDPSPGEKTRVLLYPVHSLIIASFCAAIPPFESLPSSTVAEDSAAPFAVPVRYIAVPFPQRYADLTVYFYTRNLDIFLKKPYFPGVAPISLREKLLKHEPIVKSFRVSLAAQIAHVDNPHIILGCLSNIYCNWANMCRLGVVDTLLWETVEEVWQVLIVALAIGTDSYEKVDDN